MRVQAWPHRFVYSLGRPLAASFFPPVPSGDQRSPLRSAWFPFSSRGGYQPPGSHRSTKRTGLTNLRAVRFRRTIIISYTAARPYCVAFPTKAAERSRDRALRGGKSSGLQACRGASRCACPAAPYGGGGTGLNAARDRKGSFQPGRVNTPRGLPSSGCGVKDPTVPNRKSKKLLRSLSPTLLELA